MTQPHDPVGSLAPWRPLFAEPTATLREIARSLTSENVGALVVHTPNTRPSIISERDITRALADGADPDEVWADDVSSQDVLVARPGDPIVLVALEMLDAGVRHIVLMSQEKPTGIVSMRDLLRPLVDAALTVRPD